MSSNRNFMSYMHEGFKRARSFYTHHNYNFNLERFILQIQIDKIDNKEKYYLQDALPSIYLTYAEEILRQHKIPYVIQSKDDIGVIKFDSEAACKIQNVGINFFYLENACIFPKYIQAPEEKCNLNKDFRDKLLTQHLKLLDPKYLVLSSKHKFGAQVSTRYPQPPPLYFFTMDKDVENKLNQLFDQSKITIKKNKSEPFFFGAIPVIVNGSGKSECENLLNKIFFHVDLIKKAKALTNKLRARIQDEYIPKLVFMRNDQQCAQALLKLQDFTDKLHETLTLEKINKIISEVKEIFEDLKPDRPVSPTFFQPQTSYPAEMYDLYQTDATFVEMTNAIKDAQDKKYTSQFSQPNVNTLAQHVSRLKCN